jgi:hypothetical protein
MHQPSIVNLLTLKGQTMTTLRHIALTAVKRFVLPYEPEYTDHRKNSRASRTAKLIARLREPVRLTTPAAIKAAK